MCGGRKDECAGLQTLLPWADNSGEVPVLQTKRPCPEWPESANHKGLKPAGGMACGERPEAGLGGGVTDSGSDRAVIIEI